MASDKVLIPILREVEKPDALYWVALKKAIKSDGCTKVPDVGTGWCCVGHDLRYKFAIDEYGKPCTKSQADSFLRDCIEGVSFLKKWSIIARVFFRGVKLFGAYAYADDVDNRPPFETYYWSAAPQAPVDNSAAEVVK